MPTSIEDIKKQGAAHRLGAAMRAANDALGDERYMLLGDLLMPLVQKDSKGILTVEGMSRLASALESVAALYASKEA